jgi:hypothetical protein
MKELNNNITESRCSFEVSKLLKEKGCDIPCNAYYVLDFQNFKADGVLHEVDYFTNRCHQFHIASAPTHALTIEWLRVNFGIWINIDVIDDEYRYSIEKTSGIIDTLKFNLFKGSLFDFNSPQEATEAALKYILEELV